MPSAFITGASSGIGRTLAERLAARGVVVGLAARREGLLDEVRRGIEAKGGRAKVYVLDVADPNAVVATVERAWDELGGLDLVVANAGIGDPMHGRNVSWASVGPILQTNVFGAIATLTAALPRMLARGSGHLVGVSSLAGCRGLPRSAAYSASKAALSTFLEGLRVDLAGTGVGVTDVRPGFIATAMNVGGDKAPLLMQLDEAVDRILAGIDARAGVVAFPLPLVGALAVSRLLPDALFDRVVRRLAQKTLG